MDERIRELAVQARQYAWVNETHWSAGPERERLFEQKFAELIVRECARLVASAELTKDGHTWRSANFVVLEHFGVKE